MKQLLLNLVTEKPQTLDTFVTGKNTELISLLKRIAQCAATSLTERFVYFWGEPGAGKSHLLRALATTANAKLISAQDSTKAFAYAPQTALYLIDDCEQLSAAKQVAAFNLFNQIREIGGILVVAGSAAPTAMTLREDLRTRLGWGLVYQLHGLTDEEKIAALAQTAAVRGIALSTGVLPYLLTHYKRDMRSLSAMLDALDQHSLEMQRPITLPLLRDLLQLEDNKTH